MRNGVADLKYSPLLSSHPEDRSNPARANGNPKLVAVNRPFKTSQREEFGSDHQSPVMAGQSPPEGNDKCLEHAESWPSSVTLLQAGACHDATALPCCGHRSKVPDVGPPLDHLLAQPDAATDSCKQLATRPTRASVYRQPFKRRHGKRIMPSSIEIFTVRFTVKSFHCTGKQIAC